MKIYKSLALVVLFSAMVLNSPVEAVLVTSDSDFLPTASLIDFNEFTGGWTFTGGPVVVGDWNGNDVIWSSTFQP